MRFVGKSNVFVGLLTRLSIAVTLLIVLSLSACKTIRKTTENNDHYKGHTSVEHQVDSVRIHDIDSVFVLVKGDTVWKCKYVYRYRDRVKVDSFYVHDSIRDTTTVTKEVPAQLSKTQERAIVSGWILWVLLLIAFIYFVYKLIKR